MEPSDKMPQECAFTASSPLLRPSAHDLFTWRASRVAKSWRNLDPLRSRPKAFTIAYRLTILASLAFACLASPATASGPSTLYGVDDLADQLLTIDTTTGATTAVGPLGITGITSLAFNPTNDLLFGVDQSGGSATLVTIDRGSGAATAVGAVGFADVTGLTVDTTSSTLFGVDAATNQLITINQITGAGTSVGGAIGIDGVESIAFDPTTGNFFSTISFATEGGSTIEGLITIDPLSGVGTAIGNIGVPQISGLAADPSDGTLLGVDTAFDSLLSIDSATGDSTPIGGLGFDSVVGLTFIDDTGLTGDFNNDSVVNAADYTVWRDLLGVQFTTDNFLDFTNNFGATRLSDPVVSDPVVSEPAVNDSVVTGASISVAAVPEPQAGMLLASFVMTAIGIGLRT